MAAPPRSYLDVGGTTTTTTLRAYDDYRAMPGSRDDDDDEDDKGFVNKAAFRAQTDQLVELYGLPEWRRDEVQAMEPHGGGHDGRVYRLFKDHRKYAVKRFRDGISLQLIDFHRALQRCTADGFFEVHSQRPDGPSAMVPLDKDALAVVRRAVVPVAWIHYKGQRCLVYEWIEHDADPQRRLSEADVRSLRAQVDLCHALGFCHLDITARNVLVRPEKDGGAVLIDYDCVTRVGTVPLCGTPPESSARVKNRDTVRLDDDEHLWTRLLQGM